tara:strand:- start:136 stop:1320 length:1185 start_codon:yes stop_codon:yes gene_type:complete
MTLDELLLEWSYRSERGYPTLDNPSDVSVLKEILTKLNLSEEDVSSILDELEDDDETGPKTYGNKDGKKGLEGFEDSDEDEKRLKKIVVKPEEEEEEPEEPQEKPQETGALSEYDQLIADTFGGEIPKSKNSYNFSKSTFDEQVKADDLEVWKKLWTVKPKKKTGDQTETLGVGKGELSLYWLYNHSQSSTAGKLKDGRGDDAPDLWFNGEGTDGVEVKAYGKPNGVIDLGRFGKFRDNLKILNLVFGIKGLSSIFDGTIKDQKQINALSWSGSDLKDAFSDVVLFSNVDLEQLSDPFPIFERFDTNIKFIESSLGNFGTAEEGAKLMAKKFVGDKLGRKPGWGGHLADMSINGFIRFWHIDQSKFDSYDDILGKATIGASQGAMKMHFNKIFG